MLVLTTTVVNNARPISTSVTPMLQAIEGMQSLGFSNYEARAYVALLQQQSVTAYELAKASGIPTSKIYETVARLIDRRIARPTDSEKDNKQRYVALPAADMLRRIKNDTEEKANELAPLLNNLGQEKTPDLIWPVEQEKVQQQAISMVQAASNSILLSLWPQEMQWLAPALQQRHDKGIPIALVHFGEPAPRHQETDGVDRQSIGATYIHPVEDTLYEEKGGRGLTLVTDSEQVLIANYRADGTFDGSWSRNQAFVTVAEDYVKHDVYITKVTRFLNPEMRERFGEHYEQLRNIFVADA